MASNIIALDRANVLRFCSDLPAPFIARPIVKASPRRGLTLTLEYGDSRVIVTEDGQPFRFCSFDDVMYELVDAEHVDLASIALDVSAYKLGSACV